MNMADFGMYAANLICLCIDRAQEGDYAGAMWHQYKDDPIPFINTIDMINKMEQLYDEWNFPQRSTSGRSFETRREGSRRKSDGKAGLQMSARRIEEKKGDKGTFIVRVKYRQNSTWQGEVVWVEENRKQHFRSALELLKLIDGVLDADGGEPKSVEDTEE